MSSTVSLRLSLTKLLYLMFFFNCSPWLDIAIVLTISFELTVLLELVLWYFNGRFSPFSPKHEYSKLEC